MKTLEQIKSYKSKCLDGRDLTRLMQFIPEPELEYYEIKLKSEWRGKHKAIPFTKKNILSQLRSDVAFGFEKALNGRGISASLMYEVVSMWNWILEEGLEEFDNYPQYGLPLFKATALKYGFPNPIGDDDGDEDSYTSEGVYG